VSSDASINEVTVRVTNNQVVNTLRVYEPQNAATEPVSEAQQECASVVGANIGGPYPLVLAGPCHHGPSFGQFLSTLVDVIDNVHYLEACFDWGKYGAGLGALYGTAAEPGGGTITGTVFGGAGGCLAGIANQKLTGGAFNPP
jgi:hypothetical protein